ncbi:RDD family protein [Microbacterium sp. SS28]|uniref:RDD family protein n=1 Tax=Microbacterium sp. SS28 TaxID=2919948 RepID=UPI001FA9CEE2|nr:RDD family protein [Microbacterium sp. SS28]
MTASPLAPTTPAEIGRRVFAYLVDGAIAGVLVSIATVITALATVRSATTADTLLAQLAVVYGVALVVSLAWGVVYTLMQGGRGSIGQRILGIRLADAASGASIGFGRALVRNLVWIVSLWIVIGYFTPLLDSSGRRQGWHDKAARAVVVSTKATDAASFAEPAAAAGVAASPAPVAAAPTIPAPPSAPVPVIPAPPASFIAPSTSYASAPAARPVLPAGPVGSGDALISVVPGVTPVLPSPVPSAPAPVTPTVYAPPVEVAPVVAPVVPTAAEPAPPAPAPAPAPVLAVAPPIAPAPAGAAAASVPSSPDDIDATRAAAPRARAVAALTWDDGTRTAVYGRTLFGRNPAAESGATVVAVRDETLSLSKTHFEIGGDAEGAWITDRHSTNGTVLVRDGRREDVEPGVQVPLRAGDRLEFGDRSVRVGDGS